MRLLERISLKTLIAAFLGSVLLEGLIVSMVLVSSANTMYAALVALFGVSMLCCGCAIHLAIRLARLKL